MDHLREISTTTAGRSDVTPTSSERHCDVLERERTPMLPYTCSVEHCIVDGGGHEAKSYLGGWRRFGRSISTISIFSRTESTRST